MNYKINFIIAIISIMTLLSHYYFHYVNYITYDSHNGDNWYKFVFYMAVLPDDDHGQHRSDEEQQQQPSRSQTPPTPTSEHAPSHSLNPSPRPMRLRAMAQLRPVSIPNIVSDIAWKDTIRKIAEFDRHYMPDGQPSQETSSQGKSHAHRSDLKRKAPHLPRH